MKGGTRGIVLALVGAVGLANRAVAQPDSDPDRRFYELSDLRLEGGQTLPRARLAYATRGRLNAGRTNAVWLPSAYGGGHHGYDYLLGPGRALDTTRYFVVATELFGSGASSSPSNTPAPFDRARFPAMTIRDNIAAAHRLLTAELGIPRLRAVVGYSMGAQQAFQWAVSHPDLVDAIVPICGTAKTWPHGAIRLESAISTLVTDPAFAGGDYTGPLGPGIRAWALHWTAWVYSQEWWRRELYRPTHANPDSVGAWVTRIFAGADPNDLIFQARTWQAHDVGRTPGFDGNLAAALRSIRARVLYLPCATDLYFPPGDAEFEARHVPQVTLTRIPSIWGHNAGSGANPADAAFIDARIRQFLRAPEGKGPQSE